MIILKKKYAWLLLLGASNACNSKSNGQDPAPKAQVEVRVTGADVSGLGASFEYYVKPARQQPALYLASIVNEGVTTESMGNWDQTTEATLVLEFNRVTNTSTIQPRVGSMIKGELIINGQVKSTVILDKSTAYGNLDHPANSASVLIGK